MMRATRVWMWALALPLVAGMARAEDRNPANYPLRLHIFSRSQTTFYHRENVDDAKGDGRANLFENGAPRGVDFSYDCGEKVRASFGYQTYPARWKKPGRELAVLLPEFGQTGKYFVCDLKTDVKDFAYTEHEGHMGSEPVEAFRQWMARHDYDPEHGKDVPVRTEPASAAPAPAAPAPPQAATAATH